MVWLTFCNSSTIYALEKRINDRIDQFINTILISYSKYKDELIASQRDLVENLSVPIIPLSQSVAVLPLTGMVDTYRIQTIDGFTTTGAGTRAKYDAYEL